MIFTIQRFLEDRFERRDLTDVDQYAVSLANKYVNERHGRTKEQFIASARRIRTVFFKNNRSLKRRVFEDGIVSLLDQRFLKKKRIA
jgi:hypothetical protein